MRALTLFVAVLVVAAAAVGAYAQQSKPNGAYCARGDSYLDDDDIPLGWGTASFLFFSNSSGDFLRYSWLTWNYQIHGLGHDNRGFWYSSTIYNVDPEGYITDSTFLPDTVGLRYENSSNSLWFQCDDLKNRKGEYSKNYTLIPHVSGPNDKECHWDRY